MAVLNGCFVKLSALDNMLSKFKIMRIHFLVMWRDTLSPPFLLVQFQFLFLISWLLNTAYPRVPGILNHQKLKGTGSHWFLEITIKNQVAKIICVFVLKTLELLGNKSSSLGQ